MLKKNLLRACESVCILAFFVALAAGVTLYRVHKGPINVAFALDIIEDALADNKNNIRTNITQASLFWPETDGPILLLLDGVQVTQKDVEQFSLKRAAVSVRYLPLLAGKIKPEALILDGTTLKFVRGEDNSVRMAFDFNDEKSSSTVSNKVFDPLFLLDSVLSGIGRNDPLMGLKAFEIKGASLLIEDEYQKKTWTIPQASTVFTRQDKTVNLDVSYMMKGQIQPTDITVSLSKDDNGYDAGVGFQNIDLALMGETLGLKAVQGRGMTLSGGGHVDLSQIWELEHANLNIKGSPGQLKIAGLYDDFFDVQGLGFEADYDVMTQILDISNMSIEANNVGLDLSSKIMIKDTNVQMPVIVKAKDIAVDNIAPLIPSVLEGTAVHKWLTEQLSVGTLKDVSVKLPFSISKKGHDHWEHVLGDIHADFMFENLTVDYRSPLKPATEMKGTGSFANDTLTIKGTDGRIEDLKTNKAIVILSDISKKGAGVADIDVHIDGPFKTLIDYIGDDPINLKDQLGFSPSEVKGRASVDVEVDFPTVKDLKIEEVKVKVNAKLNDIYLPKVLKGLPLTGGPMTLDARDGRFTLSGKGQLSNRPVKLEYTQYLDLKNAPYAQKVKAELVADKRLRDVFGVGLDDYIAGDLPISLTYVEKANEKSKIDVSADLSPVEFFVEPLNYKKALGQKGKATMDIFLSKGEIKEVNDLDIALYDGHIKDARLIFKKFGGESDVSQAKLPNIKLPENVLSVDLERTESNVLKLLIGAQKLDLRPYLGKSDSVHQEKSANGKQTIVSGHVDQMRVSDQGIFNGTKIYLDVSAGGDINQLELDARAGRGDIYLRYKPDPFGQLSFRLEADDAGATLKSMDLYDDIRGGKILIEATRPAQSAQNDLDGIAQITDFKVVNAPALARLLNAVSLPGLQSLLGGDGISFSKMKTSFKRRKVEQETVLTFTNGRTSGSEVGLTFEGKVNQNTGLVDVQGTVIPLSTLNKAIGSIPLVGDLLTGGGAFFAATYKMERKVGEEETKVSVNPLSALTPGILRKVLFEGDRPADE